MIAADLEGRHIDAGGLQETISRKIRADLVLTNYERVRAPFICIDLP